MAFGETKVYFDGSHYIAIPHTTRPTKKRPKPVEEEITVAENLEIVGTQEDTSSVPSISTNDSKENTNFIQQTIEDISKENEEQTLQNKFQKERKLTRKELFDELYIKYIDLRKNERKKKIIELMLPYFSNLEFCENFVTRNFERKIET